MKQDKFTVKMECYSGYRGEESPRRFTIGDRTVEVVEIIDRWLSPEYRYFKVRGSDDGIYIFRHDAVSQQWELTLFDSGAYPGSQLSST